jgi:hypothetical protein
LAILQQKDNKSLREINTYGVEMKGKTLVRIFAFIVILVGLCLISYSNMRVEKVSYSRIGSKTFPKNYSENTRDYWEVFCNKNVTENDEISVYLTPGFDWYMFAEEGLPEDPYNPRYLTVNVSLVDPFGGESIFKLIFARPIGKDSLFLLKTILLLNNGLLVVNSSEGGVVSEIGGVVKTSGNFSVRIYFPLSPPQAVEILKKSYIYERKNSFLFVPGVVISIFGSACFLFSFVFGSKARYIKPTVKKSINDMRHNVYYLHQ